MKESIITEHVIRNGELLPREHAMISLYNQALFYSFGVYESIQIQYGLSFHLDDHLQRLLLSAQILELPLPHSAEEMREWIDRLIAVDRIEESLLRVLVFGPNGDEETLVFVLPMPLPTYPASYYVQGVTAITFEGSRPLPRAKTLNTLVNYLALRRARAHGAHEAFLVNSAGCLTEGSRSNLFVVSNGRLYTPPAYQVLSGITRDIVWRLAESIGIEVAERPIHRSMLPVIDELFITSTSMHVMPVVRVDDREIGAGHVGPVTRILMAEFETYYEQVMGRAAVEHVVTGEIRL